MISQEIRKTSSKYYKDKKDILDNISLVLQGAVWPGEIDRLAAFCVHWKKIIPNCELILSISSTDMLVTEEGEVKLSRNFRDNKSYSDSLAIIKENCHKLVFSDPATTLPPIKNDSGNNHGNLQISAAKSGLRECTRPFILRIRNDIAFFNDKFVDVFIENSTINRGSMSTFEERLLISSFFTINPYTTERLPFHYSDWFHFGLSSDVKSLWMECPQIDLSDATHYRFNKYSPWSNDFEKKFFTRIGVEQWINFSYFKKIFPEITLDFHNDATDIRKSFNILKDNFIVADNSVVPILFHKYQDSFNDWHYLQLCINFEEWEKLAAGISPAELYKDKIRDARSMMYKEPRQVRPITPERVWRFIKRRSAKMFRRKF